MSKRIVDDPSLHGWVEEDGKWVWDGQSAGAGIEDGDTEGQITTWSGSEWTPESAVVVSGGNVGIGTDSPSKNLVISNNGVNGIEFEPDDSGRQSNAMLSYDRQAGEYTPIFFDCQSYKFRTHSPDQAAIPALTIDSAGSVGIGMVPLRSTSKEQLAEWKTRFDARLKAEPRADKKAVTLEITDDAFEVLPTEEALAEWMETRAAGDKLQVSGNISASGKVLTNNVGSESNSCGIRFSAASEGGASTRVLPTDTSSVKDDAIDLGSAGGRFKNGYFSGTVNANLYQGGFGSLVTTGVADWDDPSNCVSGQAPSMLKGSDANGPDGTPQYFHPFNFEYGRGQSGNTTQLAIPYKVATSNLWMRSRTSGAWSPWKEIGGGGGGLPDGDFTHNGKITATDFIATSDERVKDNITTAPVGLIDSLKGREWDWKESGEKGSGVVAQELEQVLPHLVHEDDDGMKSVSYTGLCAYLIEEVKALRAEVEALKS